jgi:hypothetical protein
MGKRKKKTVEVPPFPPLEWDDFFWTGCVVLASWAGFSYREGRKRGRKPSDGSADLNVSSPDEDADLPPSAAQAEAFRFLQEIEEAVRDAILAAILEEYEDIRESADEEELEEPLPVVTTADQLRPLLGLSTVHVIAPELDGCAYVGFELLCPWDSEHGLGVMTHRDRVVTVGQAALSFEE